MAFFGTFAAVALPYPVSLAVAGGSATGRHFLTWQLFRPANHVWTFYLAVVPAAIGLPVLACAAGTGARLRLAGGLAGVPAGLLDHRSLLLLPAVAGEGVPVPAPGRPAGRRSRGRACSPTPDLPGGSRAAAAGVAGQPGRSRRAWLWPSPPGSPWRPGRPSTQRTRPPSWPAPEASRAAGRPGSGSRHTHRQARRCCRSGRPWPTSWSSTGTAGFWGCRSAPTRCTATPSYVPGAPTPTCCCAAARSSTWSGTSTRPPVPAVFASRLMTYTRRYRGTVVHTQTVTVSTPARPGPAADHHHLRGTPMNPLRRRSLTAAAGTAVCAAIVLAARRGCRIHRRPAPPRTPIHHFVVLLQEDHTFDNYFGTYPGADGMPAGMCMPVSHRKGPGPCVRKPFRIGNRSVIDLAQRVSRSSPEPVRRRQDGRLRRGHTTQQRQRRPDDGLLQRQRRAVLLERGRSLRAVRPLLQLGARGAASSTTSYWVAGPGSTWPRRCRGRACSSATIFDRLQAAGVSWKFYVQDYNPAINYRTMAKQKDANRESQAIWCTLLDIPRFPTIPHCAPTSSDISQYYPTCATVPSRRSRTSRRPVPASTLPAA